ncbi:MAG: methylenetetrahydrofolate reductase, partial [Leptotrichiaceae bacterium]|nr:methylenetetrahydrofolate reductase [Leptotrichiaceae bacterium]
YPEVHHETNDILDLIHLKNKVEKGADFLISQVFFDNNTFYKFKENAEKIGVNAPLVAGIMPVTNAAQIRRITELCHCAVPKKLENLLDKFGHDDESMYKAGVVYAAEQIIELVSNDVKGIHLYTMNRSQAVTEILNMVNFVRK